ncbi:MAG: outer membrane protein assembly factor BamA [Candidatus Binataceae bacterium]
MTARKFHSQKSGAAVCAAIAVLIAAAFALPRAFAQGPAPIISSIEILGNQRVESDAIRIHITQQAGQPLDPAAVDSDIKSIYKMGFFDSVTANVETKNGREVLVYRVRERPQITDVRFKGMKEIRSTSDKIVAATRVHPGSILDPVAVRDTINGVTKVYQGEGYLDAKVIFRPILQTGNTAIAEFDVTEGPKVQITGIEFEGNTAFSSRTLQGDMETRPHMFLVSYLTGWGTLDQAKLDEDIDRLTAFYYDHGYLNVHVSPARIERKGNSLTVIIHIDEGRPYRVGRVRVTGNLKYPRHGLLRLLTIRPGQRFRGSTLQHNVLALSDFYSNRGYAFVNVDPRTRMEPARRRIDITFVVNPGHEVLINRIHIAGNTKTSDKVIRRELQVQEQEPYSAAAIRESKVRLDRLGFFSDTRITTSPSSQPDKIDLNVNVTEANTASFQVSGGFDSYQSLFGNFTLGNTNLFGGGESLILNAQIGFLFQNYSISYTEPWFLDMPLSVGLQLFDNKTYLLSFNQASAGFSVNTSYPLTELGFKKLGPFSLKDVNAGLGYTYESVGITGLAPLTTYQIAQYKGYIQTSELTPSIRRFTVDNPVDPRSGSVLSLTGQIGGIGGSNDFIMGVAHGRYFYPFLKSSRFGTWVLSQGITFGIGESIGGSHGSDLPLYQRFFPGGVGGSADVRGYQLYSLGPQVTLYNKGGVPISVQDVGGSKELIFSNEITFPLLSGLGLRGVVFTDAGQSFLLNDSIKFSGCGGQNSQPQANPCMQAAWGMGIRWKSPFGPLAVDIAFPLNPRPADQSTVFEVGAGSPL